ncbi:MAG: hypothetical protein LKG31_02740 [Lactobacillus sp.]|jgi:hypothetical protein|nr:hypothetical protein [Lactobacillus sp.]
MKSRLLSLSKDEFHLSDETFSDLELDKVVQIMARQDRAVAKTCSLVLRHPTASRTTIIQRQHVLEDFINYEAAFKQLYQTVHAAISKAERIWGEMDSVYASIPVNLETATAYLKIYLQNLKKVQAVLTKTDFQSEGLIRLQAEISKYLPGEYAQAIALLDRLRNYKQLLMRAYLSNDLRGRDYQLLAYQEKLIDFHWLHTPRLKLAPRDDAGANDFAFRKGTALAPIAAILVKSAKTIISFYQELARDLEFYQGALNLYHFLQEKALQTAWPIVLPTDSFRRKFVELHNAGLAGHATDIGNSLDIQGKNLYLISGTNQGGKTTFLKSLGQAQVMMQCGLFVVAKEFQAPVRLAILSHFKKAEDHGLQSGKLEEELRRMNQLVAQIRQPSLFLLDESFASTNEREGSLINEKIYAGLRATGNEIVSVTHLFSLAKFYATDINAVSLIASASRNFKIFPGQPKPTANGLDLYRRIFAS